MQEYIHKCSASQGSFDLCISRYRAQAERQNVDRGVLISVHDKTAVRTRVRALCQGLVGRRSATATTLGRAARIHRNRPYASFFRFALQYPKERGPSRVVYRLRKGAPQHELHVEIFVCDQIEVFDERLRQLAVEVPALVADALMTTSDQIPGPLRRCRISLLTFERSLSRGEYTFACSEPSRVVCLRSVVESHERTDPQIDSACRSDRSLRRRRSDCTADDADMPALGTSNHSHLSHLSLERAMSLEFHPSQRRELHATVLDTSASNGERVVPRPRPKTRMARTLSTSAPTEERLESKVQPSQGRSRSEDRKRLPFWFRGTEFRQLTKLLVHRDASQIPPRRDPLLQSGVVEVATLREPAQKDLLLRAVWFQPELERAQHVEAG